ncbi:YqjF family protein [Criblamydia sequanensis]|uniref:DUF2071 domain-containing protein n=1 Tax=Candidatus Criblamydia sequanensis CRIB-18 TaxID=1437425 RepID=A0A090D090_9BACT|nr:DUF2071 domain-containing protein [Criblamydia sequanensis]CDR34917.1 hypothetical protein CSEC_2111 [Criblamydia sequanensis CRIB-18]
MQSEKDISIEDRLKAKKLGPFPCMYQDWRHLLFLNWAYDPKEIQKTLPKGLFVDVHEGKAFLSVVVFFIENLRAPFLPKVPGLSHFIEINLRTYVYDERGVPGVWFYSLDIDSKLAAFGGRTFFHLPYHQADLKSEFKNGIIHITGQRKSNPSTFFNFSYKENNEKNRLAKPGTQDFFLVERYILYTTVKNQLKRGQVHHESYPLAQTDFFTANTNLFESNHFFKPQGPPDSIQYSPGVDVSIFPLKNNK